MSVEHHGDLGVSSVVILDKRWAQAGLSLSWRTVGGRSSATSSMAWLP